jgi:hypothetical protein
MSKLTALFCSTAICFTLTGVGAFDGPSPRSDARHESKSGAGGAYVSLAQFNPCPNGRCR